MDDEDHYVVGGDDDDDEDADIHELIKGSGIKNEDLYEKLKNVGGAQQYIEQIDEDGNVYLVEAEEDDIDGMGDDDDGDYEYGDEMMMDGDEDDLDRPVF